ncbi:uroporphyrinogen-III synthase [Actinorhabdospora filicis]|uniref:Uroporphyrinogen-III synthase n=1 Tax=Actinorhabdospora filicis TaxID=1785913 RepID=A0A9W6SG04_9ACTN|nr:uroporphyrinogen-III synthase [Actinorhabdospora filicis]GLZ75633.1 uroporphyrinogen-III synthase [Actinorhabdospora filicis]
MAEPDDSLLTGPLSGFTVAVTAWRRGAELAALLEHRGARVVSAAPLRTVAPPDDHMLRAATIELLRESPGTLIVTSGAALTSWLAAVDGWGLGARLRAALARWELHAAAPRALAALRVAGFQATSDDGTEPPRGQRLAAVIHGAAREDVLAALRRRHGAAVHPIEVHRWTLPPDLAPAQRLVDAIGARRVDAVTFTSAPAVAALLRVADDEAAALVAALRGDVLAAAVGPVSATALRRLGIPATQPPRARLTALARTVAVALPARARRVRLTSGHDMEVRGHLVVVDGTARTLPPAPMAVLRALCAARGRVLSRAELLGHLPRGADGHAVEMAVTRLRDGLKLRGCVQTVVKRGYRLAVD